MKTTNQTNTMRMGDQQQSSISILPSMGAADQSMKHQMLSREEWFHGPISRKDAEQLLIDVRGLFFTKPCNVCFVSDINFKSKSLTFLFHVTGRRLPCSRITGFTRAVCSYRNAEQFKKAFTSC